MVGLLMNCFGYTACHFSFVHTGRPPSIVAPPQPVVTTVADGVQHSTTFNCTAFGVPTPHISWMFGMQNIVQSGRFRFLVTDGGNHTSSTLTINNLTATDSGIIRCVADNPFGSASADTTLSVLSKYFLDSTRVWVSVIFGLQNITKCMIEYNG